MLSNMTAGAIQTMIALFYQAILLYPYRLLHATCEPLWGPFMPQDSWVTHVISLFGVDMGYYWAHRSMHASNLGWSTHVTHHNSPDFNYSTALRQGMFERLFSYSFYLPLAVLGMPCEIMWLHRGFNTIMQFWTHTQNIPKLWWPIEFVMNTPSHHRVHHARNYGRANYGGMLIIWDRLFGSYIEEEIQPVFGLDERQKPLGTHDPMWQQFHHMYHTFQLMVKTRDPITAWFTREPGPGMIMPRIWKTKDGAPMELQGPPCDPGFGLIDVYTWVNYLVCAAGLLWVMKPEKHGIELHVLYPACIWLAASFTIFGHLLDERPWSKYLEVLRLLAFGVGSLFLFEAGVCMRIVLFSAASLAGLGLCTFAQAQGRRRATAKAA